MVFGLMVLGCLGVPAAFASSLVTPPPPTTGLQDWPPAATTGPGTRGLPVSDQHSLRALSLGDHLPGRPRLLPLQAFLPEVSIPDHLPERLPAPVFNLRVVKWPLQFIILSPEEDTDPYFTAVNIPSRIKISYLRAEVPVPWECYNSIGRHRRAYATNYRDIILLVEDEASINLTNVTLQEEESEVHLPLQQRSHLDYMEWSLRLRLSDLSSEVRRTRCIQSLHDNYSLRSTQQPGWRVISRGEILVLVRCHHITVRPLLSASTCSEQLAVQDEESRPWRLHARNRLLTDFGVKVPCGSPSPVLAIIPGHGGG